MTRSPQSPQDQYAYEEDFNELDEFQDDEDDEIFVGTSTSNAHKPEIQKVNGVSQLRTKLSAQPQLKVVQNGTRKVSSTTQVVNRDSLRSIPNTGNRSLRLPPLKLQRKDPRNRFQPERRNDAAERVLSAKVRRIHDLENERNLLRVQVEDLKKEVRTLNQMMRRQGKALGQYVTMDDRFPSLLHQSEEENRIAREHLRTSRQKANQLREQYRQLEIYAQTVEKERDKLRVMVHDQELLDSKTLQDQRNDLAKKLAATEAKLQESERKVVTLRRSQAQGRQVSEHWIKERTKEFEDLLAENAALKHQLKLDVLYPEQRAVRTRSRGPREENAVERSRRSPSRDKFSAESHKHRLLQIASPAFLQNFRQATTIVRLDSANENKQQSTKTEVPIPQRQEPVIGTWKRTSPDLLKDHDERFTGDSNSESSNSSLASIATVIEKEGEPLLLTNVPLVDNDRRVVTSAKYESQKTIRVIPPPPRDIIVVKKEDQHFNHDYEVELDTKEPPKDETRKNILLDKIKQLDSEKRDREPPRAHQETVKEQISINLQPKSTDDRLDHGDRKTQNNHLVKTEQLKQDFTFGGNVRSRTDLDDDDLEEIEFF